MASLDPTAYPTPSTSMLQLEPAMGRRGDDYLDRETMVALIEAVSTGFFVLHEDWAGRIVDADDALLEKTFLDKLRGSRLGENAAVLHHRRLALYEAIKELGTEGTIPGFGLSVHNLTRVIGDVETWTEGKRQELEGQGFTNEQVLRMLLIIPASVMAALLGLSEASLSRMRNLNEGPRYVKLGTRRVGYPVVSTLEWLAERMS
jgi:predicted DNA-binding transcriptional regulator AlpA